ERIGARPWDGEEREPGTVRPECDDARPLGRRPQRLGQELGQPFDRGGARESFEREILAEGLLDSCKQAGPKQRDSPEFEKVIVDSNGLKLDELLPDGDQTRFEFGPWGGEIARVWNGPRIPRGLALALDLAAHRSTSGRRGLRKEQAGAEQPQRQSS